MKKIFSLFFLIGLMLNVLAQAPQGFSYQAVIRNAEGQPLTEQDVSIRLTLQSEDGVTEYYSETHSLQTSPQGVVTVSVGSGNIEKGSLADTPWAAGGIHLKVEVDPTGGTAYSLLGTSPLLAVPYALFAASGNEGPQGPEGPPGPEGPLVAGTDGQTLRHDGTAWVASSNLHNADTNVGVGTVTPTEKLEVAGNIKAHGRFIGQGVEVNQPLPEEEPIFVVRNSQNQVVFAVYEGGVRAYVDDTSKQTRGGFAIGGLSDQIKEEGVHYFSLTPDSARIHFRTPAEGDKQTRGGFAVGGLSDQNKAQVATNLLFIAPDSARIYVDSSPSKQTRGGFAVGGLSDQNKGEASNFLYLTPENYFIGHRAGNSTTTGHFNSFFGYEAGLSNTEGKSGIFIGYRAGMQNINGNYNTFIGNYAGGNNTVGTQNVFIGDSAGIRNNTGSSNIFLGSLSGKHNISGPDNVAIGTQAGMSNTSGRRNIFIGSQAGWSNTTGRLNIFIGVVSGPYNTTGERNIFIGQGSGFSNTTSWYNVFIGDRTGSNNTTGESNVFMGWWSGAGNRTGHRNVYIGQETAFLNQSGNSNVYVGYQAGKYSYGEKNVFIGPKAGFSESSSNRLHIANNENQSLIYGEFDNLRLEINGTVQFKEILNLKPQSTTPGKPEVGDVFYDASTNSIKFFNGTNWMELSATVAASPPVVETYDVPNWSLTFESCEVRYLISSEGSSEIIESGVFFSTSPFISVEFASKASNSTSDIGLLTVSKTDLSVLTKYYVRSFATNSQGTALGNLISFTTPDYPFPTVTTVPVINITQTTAMAGGNVTKEGDAAVTERGICWSTTPNPTTANNVVQAGSGLGNFTCEITGLTPGTTYYVRAFATNSIATSYGSEVVFSTAPEQMTVTDADNNVYNIVQIGTQTWMKENLRTTKYNDGTDIPLVTDDVSWSELTSPAFCWYNNDETSNANIYGALYNWFAVNTGNLCPTGWHAPNDTEWAQLANYLGGNAVAGGKLKEDGTTHWSPPNTDATNETGFTALPGGNRILNGSFNGISSSGHLWSAMESGINPDNASSWYLTYNNVGFYLFSYNKRAGLSIRCIKD